MSTGVFPFISPPALGSTNPPERQSTDVPDVTASFLGGIDIWSLFKLFMFMSLLKMLHDFSD